MSQHFLFRFTTIVCSSGFLALPERKSVVLTIEERVKVSCPPIFHHFTYLNKFSYLNNDKFSVTKGVRIIEVLL